MRILPFGKIGFSVDVVKVSVIVCCVAKMVEHLGRIVYLTGQTGQKLFGETQTEFVMTGKLRVESGRFSVLIESGRFSLD